MSIRSACFGLLFGVLPTRGSDYFLQPANTTAPYMNGYTPDASHMNDDTPDASHMYDDTPNASQANNHSEGGTVTAPYMNDYMDDYTPHASQANNHSEGGQGSQSIGPQSEHGSTTLALDNFPAGLMAAGAVNETLSSARTRETYNEIDKAVKQLVDKLPSECNNKHCPRGEFAGCVVRLAGHDFMDFDGKDFGGSDGCVDFADPDNAGLKPCLVHGENGQHLNDAFKWFKTNVSLADFLVIAAEAVMHRQRGSLTPGIDFAEGFTWGRVTRAECAAVETSKQQRLPNPDDSCAANKKTFVNNLNLTWRQTAALMGVHTLGRARTEHSGFDGWWSDAQSQNSFNNDYYISMTLKGWAPETVAKSGKSQWRRVGTLSGTHTEMMLDTDLCLAFSNQDGSDISAKARKNNNDDCCAWMMPSAFSNSTSAKTAIETNAEKGRWCGFEVDPAGCAGGDVCADEKTVRHWCCTDGHHRSSGSDCNNIRKLGGRAANDILEFASHEDVWLRVFLEAWRKATQPRWPLFV